MEFHIIRIHIILIKSILSSNYSYLRILSLSFNSIVGTISVQRVYGLIKRENKIIHSKKKEYTFALG